MSEQTAYKTIVPGAPPSRIGTRLQSILESGYGPAIPVVLVLCLWQIGAKTGVIDETFFPAPTDIADTFIRLWGDGEMGDNLLTTMYRVAAGFAIALVAGTVIGIAMARITAARLLIDPLIAATYPIPAIALLPLLLVILGLGSKPLIALSAIVAFFPIVINTTTGIQEVDSVLVRMARNLGATNRHILWKILIPAALPSMFAGVRLGLGLALLGTIAGEFVAASTGMGAAIWNYWQVYRIQEMYAALVMVVIVGFSLTYGMLYLRGRFFAWSSAATRETG